MKPGSTPTPPDDETPDPLLTTLRQRLGDYGATPPPAAWAAIRQRVAAPPRPWWRRPRRLLPLLALLLSGLLLGILAGQRGQRAGGPPAARHEPGALAPTSSALAASTSPELDTIAQPASISSPQPNSSLNPTTPSQPASTGPNHPLAAPLPTATEATTQPTTASAQRLAPMAFATKPVGQRGAKASGSAAKVELLAAPQRQMTSRATAASQKLKPASAVAGNRLRRRVPRATSAARDGEPTGEYASNQKATAATLRAASRRAKARLAGGDDPWGAQRATQKATAAGSPAAATWRVRPLASAQQASAQQTNSPSIAALLASPRRSRRSRAAHRAGQLAKLPDSAAGVPEPATAPGTSAAAEPADFQLSFFGERGPAIDLLALRKASLLLPEAARPTIPAARPDSTPLAHAGRRWSLLLLAGPTLSYRTLGPAPTLAAGRPDFARLERPALGLGAQVQVRRVLSGRWAVAAGMGYHEYATRLALSVKDSGTYTSARQRDTYRLLTLPVQFTYALGAPHGRLAVGLLLGTELGWYLGGRSTEGSDCGCQQRVYPTDSARTSPYRPLSVAFSLGLDLRYRLGGPASRWHLVVQPTGRYVATPFVRSDAVGFTRRQPFSLGLMTGFSWDLR